MLKLYLSLEVVSDAADEEGSHDLLDEGQEDAGVGHSALEERGHRWRQQQRPHQCQVVGNGECREERHTQAQQPGEQLQQEK